MPLLVYTRLLALPKLDTTRDAPQNATSFAVLQATAIDANALTKAVHEHHEVYGRNER